MSRVLLIAVPPVGSEATGSVCTIIRHTDPKEMNWLNTTTSEGGGTHARVGHDQILIRMQ